MAFKKEVDNNPYQVLDHMLSIALKSYGIERTVQCLSDKINDLCKADYIKSIKLETCRDEDLILAHKITEAVSGSLNLVYDSNLFPCGGEILRDIAVRRLKLEVDEIYYEYIEEKRV